MSTKYVQKYFVLMKVKSIDEIDHDTPASSA